MPEVPPPIPKPRRKRKWLRRLFWSCFGLILLLLIFHRPIVHYGGQWVAIRLAKAENIELDLRIEGNVWSHLEIRDVRARQIGAGPAPVEHASLDRLSVDYDLLKLVGGDLKGLRALEIGTLEAVITPQPSTKKKTKPPEPLAETLRALLAKPLPAPRVIIGRVDVRVKGPKADTVVENFRLSLTAGTPGVAAWDRIEIPGLPAWAPFEAQTHFAPGELKVIQPVKAGYVTVLSLLARQTSGGTPGKVELAMNLPGAHLAVTAGPAATGSDLRGNLAIENVDLPTVGRHLGREFPVGTGISKVAVDFSGDPEKPASWQAEVQVAAANQSTEPPFAGAAFALQAALKEKTLTITTLDLTVPGVRFRGEGSLPRITAMLEPGQAPPPAGTLNFTLVAEDLSQLSSSLKTPLAGQAKGVGMIWIEDNALQLSFDLDGTNLASGPHRMQGLSLQSRFAQSLNSMSAIRTLHAQIGAKVTGVASGELQVGDVRLVAKLHEKRAEIVDLTVQRGPSTVELSGTALFTDDGKFAKAPEAKFTLSVPALEDFGVMVQQARLAGSVSGEGTFTLGEPVAASRGDWQVVARNLRLGDAPIGELELQAAAADGMVVLKKFTAQLAGQTTIDAGARVALAAPHAYSGTLTLRAPNLTGFEPVLQEIGKDEVLNGDVRVDWEGHGDLAQHHGSLKVNAEHVQFGTTYLDEVRLAARFTPTSVEVDDLTARFDKFRATAQLNWKDRRATLSELDVRYDNTPILSGSLSAPLDPKAKEPLPSDAPIQANLLARDLDLARLFAAIGRESPLAGKISLNLEAGGTLAHPSLKLETKGVQLAAVTPTEKKEKRSTVVQPAPAQATPPPPAIPPTDFDLRVTLVDTKVDVAGSVRQPLLQPLTFSANTTFALQPLLEGQKLDPRTMPLSAKVDLPASSLAFLPKLAPAVARIDGTAAVSVRAGGTIGKPELEGSTTLDLKLARFADGALPLITNYKARLLFSGNRLSIGEFTGEAGGGKFALTGSIGLETPANPVFDLALKSKDVLVMRDDTLLVRAETDLALRGPLKAASASGTIFVTESRFNKEIEILPLSLPGKPKPVPRVAAQQKKAISFPNAPLRDWKFDIAVKTRPDDPFLVKGNLARGRAGLDVRLAGTGLEPYLTGAATVEQFSATLPLSTLTTRRGVITFSQQAPFEPYVEIEAESRIRQYVVIARVTGPASKPQMDLESEPPLPQQEILSLLTTGSLSGEIGANNTALATRAAVLVVKQWYNKLFRKNVSLDDDKDGESLLDRFEVDFGAVDPKTGRNETTAQVKLTDRLFFIGDLELGGGITGRFKYLFRFR